MSKPHAPLTLEEVTKFLENDPEWMNIEVENWDELSNWIAERIKYQESKEQ